MKVCANAVRTPADRHPDGAGDINRLDPDVYFFVDPDRARTLVAIAWWQVTIPLMTGIIGCVVQNWICCVPIVYAMCVGLAGGCLSVGRTSRYELTLERLSIVAGHTQAKAHLVGVFIADFLITTGTIVSLRRRATTQLPNRILRMMFESAVLPTIITTTDLILTQTLGSKVLWHLLVNAALGKIYVISLLCTLNSVNEYQERDQQSSDRVYSYGNRRGVRPPTTDIELSPRCATRSTQLTLQTDFGPITPTSTPTTGCPLQVVVTLKHCLNSHLMRA
ncbi:hypothetical protein B0H13DRAFT_2510806 [Mycena leptocephala]|nr:hypothetical protein B0H13DRAFT_2510806 [Mycena leptocephala]